MKIVRDLLAQWLMCLLLALTVCAAGNESVNPIPTVPWAATAPSTIRTWQRQELPAITGRYFPDAWVRSGGLHAISASCISTAFATEAFVQGPPADHVQASSDGTGGAVAINYAALGVSGCTSGTTVARVAICSLSGNSSGNFNRAAGSNYFVNYVDTVPAIPTGCAGLMDVTIASGALTVVNDISNRSSLEGPLRIQLVSEHATSGNGTVASPWEGWSSAINCGKHIFFPAGFYRHTLPIVCPTGAHIEGAGRFVTRITYNPSTNGTVAWTIGNTASETFDVDFGGFRIVSDNNTLSKTALLLIDISNSRIHDLDINGVTDKWTGGTGNGSQGLIIRGRDTTTVSDVTISADLPLYLDGVPVGDNRNLDSFNFHNLYLIGSTPGNLSLYLPLIVVDPAAYLTHIEFTGRQSWVGGTYGLFWNSTASVASHLHFYVEHMRWEQNIHNGVGPADIGFCIYISAVGQSMQGFTGVDIECGGPDFINGIFLTGVLGIDLQQYHFNSSDHTAHPNSAWSLWFGTNTGPVTLTSVFLQNGSAINFATSGLKPVYDSGLNSYGKALVIYDSGPFVTNFVTNDVFTPTLWVPTLIGDSVAGANTYTIVTKGLYTRVGRVVTASATIVILNKDAAMAGNVLIGGFPVAAVSLDTSFYQSVALGTINAIAHSSANFTQFTSNMVPGTKTATLLEAGNDQVEAAINSTAIRNGSALRFTIVYFIE